MKKLLFSIFILFITSQNAFSAPGFDTNKLYFEDYQICTRAYNVIYDSKRKLFIIPEDIKRYSVNIIFTNSGKIIKFADKNIQYKNGRISKIGNDYITYLNGNLYTIGCKKVTLDANKSHVLKIGNLNLHQYFIGTKFSQAEAVKSNGQTPGMSFSLLADGSDFGGSFSDVVIAFDDTEILEGPTKQKPERKNIDNIFGDKIKSIGQRRVEYWSNGKLRCIGNESVDYWSDGKIQKIGNKNVLYWSNGKIMKIGNESVDYSSDGRIKSIGQRRVEYWSNGRLRCIGNESVQY